MLKKGAPGRSLNSPWIIDKSVKQKAPLVVAVVIVSESVMQVSSYIISEMVEIYVLYGNQ